MFYFLLASEVKKKKEIEKVKVNGKPLHIN